MSYQRTGRRVSISSSSPAFLKRGSKDWSNPMIDVVHPVTDVNDSRVSGVDVSVEVADDDALTKAVCIPKEGVVQVQDAATLLREEYDSIVSNLRRHQNIALEALTWKLRGCDNGVDEVMANSVERLKREKYILRETIDGLNETLVDQRIKVTELKERNKRYKREKIQLRNYLAARIAEVNYLTKFAAPAGDPSVVRKIANLEARNRELVAKCQKLILLVRGIKKKRLSCHRDDSSQSVGCRNFTVAGTTSTMRRENSSENGERRYVPKLNFKRRNMTRQRRQTSRVMLVLLPSNLSQTFKPPSRSVGRAAQTERSTISTNTDNESKLSSKYQVLVNIEPDDHRPSVMNSLKNSLHRRVRPMHVNHLLNESNEKLFSSALGYSSLTIDSKLIDAILCCCNLLRKTEYTPSPINVQILRVIRDSSGSTEDALNEPVAITDNEKRKKFEATETSDKDRELIERGKYKCETENSTKFHSGSNTVSTSSYDDTIQLERLQFKIVANIKSAKIITSDRNTQTLITSRYNEPNVDDISNDNGFNELPIILRVLKRPRQSIARKILIKKLSNIPYLKNIRTNCSPSTRNVRFDPYVKCFGTDAMDSKTSCAKRTEFIQGAHDLSRVRKTFETSRPKGKESSPPIHTQYSLVRTVYNSFV